MKYRTEFDSIGKIKVPGDKYWGASTERSNKYFNIGDFLVRPLVIHSIAIIKKAAAIVNAKNKDLDQRISKYIVRASDEVLKGKHDKHFPLKVWQTGSGTQSNMNTNEVIANRAHVLNGGSLDLPECGGSLINSEVNLSEEDYKNLEILHEKLVEQFSDNVADEFKSINFRDHAFQDSSHHLGGIPLSNNLSNSVIDSNLKVIDSEGIYICSSSVFQHSGSSNPTLTIVALGMRLADHLNRIN